MNIQIKKKWDKNYRCCNNEFPQVTEVLLQNQHLLPEQGSALDLACGRGANAICLAENGLTVSAWDISSSALEHLTNKATDKRLSINTECRDILEDPPETDSFDIIVVSRFLERILMNAIRNAIKPEGLVFYQTFIKERVNATGPDNPDYLLDKNELLGFFADWEIIVYREERRLGKLDNGFRDQAMIITQKI